MSAYNFSLLAGDTGPLLTGNDPDRLHVPRTGHRPLLKEGDQVLAGTKIAEAVRPDQGDLHAPMAGTIEAISTQSIDIKVTGTDRAEPEPAPGGTGDTLKEWLRSNGINTAALRKSGTVIINAVPPEPGIFIFEPLLRDYRKTLELGLETIQKIITPSKMFLATARGNRGNAFPNCTIIDVPPVYPNGLDPMVIKLVTGKEILLGTRLDDVTILSVRDLFFIGRVMETGRPLIETVISIGPQVHLVRVGTPVAFLIDEAGATVQSGDRVVLGGLLRGISAQNMAQGIAKKTEGLYLIRQGEGFTPTDNFCLGCGECERHCPSRIMPGMISRCAEFKKFERAEDFHIHSCMECGLCAYYCTAQRPLLQYIRLAKYELALLRSATSSIQNATGGGHLPQMGEDE